VTREQMLEDALTGRMKPDAPVGQAQDVLGEGGAAAQATEALGRNPRQAGKATYCAAAGGRDTRRTNSAPAAARRVGTARVGTRQRALAVVKRQAQVGTITYCPPPH
jgi:hypothetical protein